MVAKKLSSKLSQKQMKEMISSKFLLSPDHSNEMQKLSKAKKGSLEENTSQIPVSHMYGSIVNSKSESKSDQITQALVGKFISH